MTRNELKWERRMQKIRERTVKAELATLKRQKQLQDNIENIILVMTFILLVGLVIVAFTIDAFGTERIPVWVYAIAMTYIGIYSYIVYKKLTK